MSDFTDRVERFSLGEHSYGCECSGCTPLAISHASTIDTLCAERDQARDELAAALAKGDGVAAARLEASNRLLQACVAADSDFEALYGRLRSEHSTHEQQVALWRKTKAYREAAAYLADAGRGLP